jgi:6-pyruvoyltetrahydropterin/6-carboxytetrahydropterin synthase
MKLSVHKDVEFCYGHRLLGYVGPCQNLHGHTGKIRVTLTADQVTCTDPCGMLVDFTVIKKAVKKWVDENWDHSFLVNSEDADLADFLQAHSFKHFTFASVNPTAENMAAYLLMNVLPKVLALPKGVYVESVQVFETESSCAIAREDLCSV